VRIEISVNRSAAEGLISDLLKLATSQANDKDYPSAITSLRRAYALMETASTEWPEKTYFRLARYLHLSGDYEGAISWLQQLLDGFDARCDAREQLYKQWGWMQGGGKPATIPKSVRNNVKREIKDEIALFKEREEKIQERLKKKTAVKKAAARRQPKGANNILDKMPVEAKVLAASDVNSVLFNFTQRCFIGESASSIIDGSAAAFVFDRLAAGSLSVHGVHKLPPRYKSVVRELLTQYLMFLEMNRGLPFPPNFLDGSSESELGTNLLAYVCEHKWPFPQMLDSR